MGSTSSLLDEIGVLLKRLSEDAERGVPILVEGPSDIRALRELGVDGNFIAVRAGGGRFTDVVERVKDSVSGEVIILTDLDRAGEECAFSLAEELERMGLRPDLAHWRRLRALVGSFSKDVESLPSLVETLMRRAGLRRGRAR